MNQTDDANEADQTAPSTAATQEIEANSLPDMQQREAALRAEIDQTIDDAGNFESAAIAMLMRLAADQSHMRKDIGLVGGQQAFVLQQVGAMYEAVRQLWQGVQGQVVHSQKAGEALQAHIASELGKFQMDGPQRAMAGVFGKLFRDLIKHMDTLDDMLAHAESAEARLDGTWVESLRVLHRGLAATLADWGCTPTPVAVNEEHFDPAHHEAVEPLEGEVPEGIEHKIIVNVRRRGWQFNGQVLRYPQVVVA